MAACIRRSYTPISTMVSKSSIQLFLKLYAHTFSYSNRCLLLRGLKNIPIWKFIYSLNTEIRLIVVYKLFFAFQYAKFPITCTHIIFYSRLRPILIKSAVSLTFDVITILPMCSGLVIKTLSKLHEEKMGIFQ